MRGAAASSTWRGSGGACGRTAPGERRGTLFRLERRVFGLYGVFLAWKAGFWLFRFSVDGRHAWKSVHVMVPAFERVRPVFKRCSMHALTPHVPPRCEPGICRVGGTPDPLRPCDLPARRSHCPGGTREEDFARSICEAYTKRNGRVAEACRQQAVVKVE